MQQKVGIRFKINPKIYSFLCDISVKKGDYVIVETSLGQALGAVETVEEVDKNSKLENLKKVLRIATDKDLAQNEKNLEREREAIAETKSLAEKFNLDMNVVNAEFSFDGTKVIIDFISETRVDFRDLVKELATKLKTRIELRQIGIRDQAKMVGGIGICGRVCCCASHLKDFEKVSIKMAKVQGLALNPTKISGSCGRLMCCLEYENEYYSDVYPRLPKLNSEVLTKDGKGTVLSTNALTQLVSVRIEAKDGSISIKEYNINDVKKPVTDNVNQPKNNEKKQESSNNTPSNKNTEEKKDEIENNKQTNLNNKKNKKHKKNNNKKQNS